MAATPSGKDKTMRWMRVHVGGYDLSGDARTFSSLDSTFGEADTTGWNESVYNYLSDGRRQVGIAGLQVLMNDDTGRGYAVLKDGGTAYPISLFFGGGGEPAVPDPAYILPGLTLSGNAALDGAIFTINADAKFRATNYAAGSDNPHAVTLSYGAKTSTTTGTSHDNEAASTAGWSAILHVTASSGGTWEFKLQHSTDDSSFSDLATFSADGSAVTAEYASGSGTVNQYVRLVETRTSGTVTTSCAFARN